MRKQVNGKTVDMTPEETAIMAANQHIVSPVEHREQAYNTRPAIEWDGTMLTVTQAAGKWQYYAAEGNTAKMDALTALIAEAKAAIRKQYPDGEG